MWFYSAALSRLLWKAVPQKVAAKTRKPSKPTSVAPKPVPTARQSVVRFWNWGIANAARIHYREIRPIPQVKPGVLPRLPFTTDCSGDVTMGYQYAGAPNPNRHDGSWKIRGTEYTGTLLDVGKRIPIEKVRPGDLVVFGCKSIPAGHHVCGVIAVHSTTLEGIECSSHGQEAGPFATSAADEARYQPDGAAGVVFLSYLP